MNDVSIDKMGFNIFAESWIRTKQADKPKNYSKQNIQRQIWHKPKAKMKCNNSFCFVL